MTQPEDMTDAELDQAIEKQRVTYNQARARYDLLCAEKTLRRIEGRTRK